MDLRYWPRQQNRRVDVGFGRLPCLSCLAIEMASYSLKAYAFLPASLALLYPSTTCRFTACRPNRITQASDWPQCVDTGWTEANSRRKVLWQITNKSPFDSRQSQSGPLHPHDRPDVKAARGTMIDHLDTRPNGVNPSALNDGRVVCGGGLALLVYFAGPSLSSFHTCRSESMADLHLCREASSEMFRRLAISAWLNPSCCRH